VVAKCNLLVFILFSLKYALPLVHDQDLY
jgi:hypothetical protein